MMVMTVPAMIWSMRHVTAHRARNAPMAIPVRTAATTPAKIPYELATKKPVKADPSS